MRPTAQGWSEHPSGTSIVGVVATGRPTCVLTYDDGPTEGDTEAILSALEERGFTATFFVLMCRARTHPRVLADLVAAGHEVGLHGLDHRRLTELPHNEAAAHLAAGRDELEQLIGRTVAWFRPPYGAQSVRTWHATVDAGMTPVLWATALHDWVHLPASEQVDRAVAFNEEGAIILAHDGFADSSDQADDGCAPSVDRGALARLLFERLRSIGITGLSLSDALNYATPRTRVWLDRSRD